jgi:hypothetical protein
VKRSAGHGARSSRNIVADSVTTHTSLELRIILPLDTQELGRIDGVSEFRADEDVE